MDALDGSVARYRRSESWISRLTLILGAIAAMAVGLRYGFRWGIGLMTGAVLAWLNFRWLKQGLDGLTESIAAEGPQGKGVVPLAAYAKALLRYGLIALIVYVIFRYLNVPVLSMVFGLCALGAAALAVSVHEILGAQE